MKPSTQPPRTPSRLSNSLHHQLNMYAFAASAAGVGLLSLTPPRSAEAKIIYTPAHKRIAFGDVVPIDVNHDGIYDLSFAFATHHAGKISRTWLFLSTSNKDAMAARHNYGGYLWPRALKPGVTVGKQLNFKHGPNTLAGYCWHPGSGECQTFPGAWAKSGYGLKNHYLGLKFNIQGKVHYGWARLTVDPFPKKGNKHRDIVGHLTGYAYETTPNKPIITGKTKGPDVITLQPGSLGRLALGLAGLPAGRSAK